MNLLKYFSIIAAAIPLVACAPSQQVTETESGYPMLLTEQELMANPSLLGGIYAVYPGPGSPVNAILTGDSEESPKLTPAPEGYTPFYISHYGRHGSRFQGNEKRYISTLERFEQADSLHNLTAFGEQLLPQIRQLREYARGHGGELSTVGEAQHRALAERMYHNFPEVFAAHSPISARSSVVGRCRASMLAFESSLLQCDSTLDIVAETDSSFMQYLAYDSPEEKQLDSDTAAWKRDYAAFARQHLQLGRLMDTLFIHPEGLDSLMTYADLYWLAVGMQDLDVPPLADGSRVDLSRVFTVQELWNAYRCINYRMYVCNANCPVSRDVPAHCAHNLLNEIISCANAKVAWDSPEVATLRFGHDSHLLRLMALMHIHNAANVETDPERYWTAWQECILSPMAANLQMIFYRSTNPQDPILVKFLHNENETSLDADIQPVQGPYYRWEEVRNFWMNQLDK